MEFCLSDYLYFVSVFQASLTQKLTQRMSQSMGFMKNKKRVEFMKMRGPRGKGCAEMAVSRLKGSGPETPDLENFPVGDFEDDTEVKSSISAIFSKRCCSFV